MINNRMKLLKIMPGLSQIATVILLVFLSYQVGQNHLALIESKTSIETNRKLIEEVRNNQQPAAFIKRLEAVGLKPKK
jgi:hypothetical protein